MSSSSTKIPPPPAPPSSPDDWDYDFMRGMYRNVFTGAHADEPDSDIPAVGSINASAEEEGFTIGEQQYRAGVRLAVSERSGLVKRCPVCRRRRLVTVPKEGATFLACAGSLPFPEEDEAASSRDVCDFERKMP